MNFVNHTPFPSLAFEGLDQYNQSFHVVVLRQTLTWKEDGILTYADEQEPLCEQDTFMGEPNQSTVRQETDLCHYKPQCDVIVNAVGYAPQNQAVSSFGVHLAVKRPDCATPLISKTLRIIGQRDVVFSNGQHIENGVKLPKGWHLTAPIPLTHLPVCHEFAFGGETPALQEPPIDATCFLPNRIGKGFSNQNYLTATEIYRFPAPQIEYWYKPLTLADFEQFLQGQLPEKEAVNLVASLTIHPKDHPDRNRLVGTIDEAFMQSGMQLPQDFDFAIWNAAPPDQQCPFLEGNETLELFNLCPPNAIGAKINEYGDTVLTLNLPAQSCFMLVRLENETIFTSPMKIDTLIIEPQLRRLTLVWRMVLDKDLPIRVLEARMWSFQERDAIKSKTQRLSALFEQLAKQEKQHGG